MLARRPLRPAARDSVNFGFDVTALAKSPGTDAVSERFGWEVGLALSGPAGGTPPPYSAGPQDSQDSLRARLRLQSAIWLHSQPVDAI